MTASDPLSIPATVVDSGTTDASLLRRYQTGEQAAATELYRRYADRLLRMAAAQTSPDVAPRADAEDIVQSVFAPTVKKVAEIVPNKLIPKLKPMQPLKPRRPLQ